MYENESLLQLHNNLRDLMFLFFTNSVLDIIDEIFDFFYLS